MEEQPKNIVKKPLVRDFKAKVTRALKKAGLYSESTVIQSEALASAMLTLYKANAEIEALDGVLIVNTTSQGTTSTVHPAFRVQRDAMDQITRQMKQLNLTTGDLIGEPDIPDAADALLAKVNAVR